MTTAVMTVVTTDVMIVARPVAEIVVTTFVIEVVDVGHEMITGTIDRAALVETIAHAAPVETVAETIVATAVTIGIDVTAVIDVS